MNNKLTFAVAANNEHVLKRNLLASPCLRNQQYPIVIQWGYKSAALAYNDVLSRIETDLVVFVHQDVVLPAKWISDLFQALEYLEVHDPMWGVLGSFGVTQDNVRHGFVHSGGQGVLGKAFSTPERVQTLDEIVLVVRKASGIQFDATLPHFHCYGTDICLRALSLGMHSYAISAYCMHNTQELLVLPPEFYTCCAHTKRLWKQYLPIQTSCIRITRYNMPIIVRRMREMYLRYIQRTIVGSRRMEDVSSIVPDVCQEEDPEKQLGCRSSSG